MTRKEGIEWVKLYDGCCGDHYIKSFCDYIGISWDEFWEHVDKSVNRSLFQKNTVGRWERTFEVE